MATKNPDKHGFDFLREMWGVIFMAAGMFFALCLVSYSPSDPALNAVSNVGRIGNLCGVIGAYAADILLSVFGISAYVVSLVLFTLSLMQFFRKPIVIRVREALFALSLVVCVSALLHLRFESIDISGHAIAGGGIVGGVIGEILAKYLNRPGAYVVLLTASAIFFMLATRLTVQSIIIGTKHGVTWFVIGIWRGAIACGQGVPPLVTRSLSLLKKTSLWMTLPFRRRGKNDDTERLVRIERPSLAKPRETISTTPAVSTFQSLPLEGEPPALSSTGVHGPKILERGDVRQRRIPDSQLKFLQMRSQGYTPPPISLLDADDKPKLDIDEEALKKNSLLLERKLTDFEVAGHVTAIHPGPVITMYEFEPAAGTKVNKVVNLEDDLSLTLGGRSVRIIPHLPGKAAVGIEVPNHEREIVWLKDIIASTAFQKSSYRIPLALGTNTEGHPVVTDLTRMPHLLIAGSTGSGKSVAINSMIISILYKLSPADVRMILIDPKMLELSVYDGIPHLLLPVVTKSKLAISAMRWAVKEMERRYRMMADSGTRNIASYNEKIKKGGLPLVTPEQATAMVEKDREAVTHVGPIPYILIIIDELADLMMTSSQEMEETITRLAQMARAAGIHLTLATQRPSVDVVTGLIKANFPARIAFKVSARHDSRTILDSMGAEQLLGAGDMLFMSPSGGGITRHHGCLVTDGEIARVVAHVKQQGEPIYDESILVQAENEDVPGVATFDEVDDEMYDQAVRLVTETRQASISMVQRRLRIGYNRAARMIERMEAEGVIGPAEGSKPRDVLAGAVEK